jgi:SAM-dependent methyltransferase
MSDRVRDWVSFWDQPHSIYVNARHFDVHYRDIAEATVKLAPKPAARILDYGCGEATHADRVAATAGRLLLCESSANVRAKLAGRFRDDPKVVVLDPEAVAGLPDASLDFILVNSLVQYLSSSELDRLLALWRRLLAPGGRLVVGDVIPPGVGAIDDVLALLKYAARNGFLTAALAGLVRTAFSPYGKLRRQLGIANYSETEFLDRLRRAGFSAERLPFNIEHHPKRMTFLAEPQPST